jgi:hypothetical protein
MSEPLDDAALRRHEWSEVSKIKLCDGQEWTFPRPVVGFSPVRKDGKWTAEQRAPYGDEFREASRAYIAMPRDSPSDFVAFLGARINLAAELLYRNYDLTDDQLVELLDVTNDEASLDMWTEIDRLICF